MKPLPVQDGLILRSYFKTVWHQDPGAQHVAYCGPKNLLPAGQAAAAAAVPKKRVKSARIPAHNTLHPRQQVAGLPPFCSILLSRGPQSKPKRFCTYVLSSNQQLSFLARTPLYPLSGPRSHYCRQSTPAHQHIMQPSRPLQSQMLGPGHLAPQHAQSHLPCLSAPGPQAAQDSLIPAAAAAAAAASQSTPLALVGFTRDAWQKYLRAKGHNALHQQLDHLLATWSPASSGKLWRRPVHGSPTRSLCEGRNILEAEVRGRENCRSLEPQRLLLVTNFALAGLFEAPRSLPVFLFILGAPTNLADYNWLQNFTCISIKPLQFVREFLSFGVRMWEGCRRVCSQGFQRAIAGSGAGLWKR
eukprot:319927-Pelagomonas_calceolata.AAC.2